MLPEPCVGAHQEVHVGEAGHGGAAVGVEPVAPRVLRQFAPRTAHDLQLRERRGDVEAGAPGDGVDLHEAAVGGDQAGGCHGLHRAALEGHVGPVERGVVVVGQQDALAARGVGRGEARLEFGALHLRAEVALADPLRGAEELRGPGEGQGPRLALRVHARAHHLHQPRRHAVQLLREARSGAVVARNHPGRGALEEREVLHQRRERGHQLDGRGARAHHRHALAPQVHRLVPRGRVELYACERLAPGHLGELRVVQRAHAEHEVLRLVHLAAGGGHRPRRALVAPGAARDLLAEAAAGEHAVIDGHALEVREDLLLWRVQLRPLGVLREGEGVEVRGHVAGAAGVAVLAPGASDARALLQHHEAAPRFLERDGHAQAREPRADDDRVEGAHGAVTSERFHASMSSVPPRAAG